MRIIRFATVSPNGMPHVVPVCYVYRSGAFWAAIDYGTRNSIGPEQCLGGGSTFRPD